ncbi:SURF1 family protein [Undibacterium rugosum]|uniref:SURF1-like protein n=1 Tax=Undibacterium rugosum TaxID=2762291 RepID=A0A923I2A4_9BURK|nr:SURF1 family protein [Undibacterium rugosum]MBC3936376.1 SURF1 family protein [Undibacterium rugosum]MBR7779936.1 SURF1 family protein [Undibacterium rugosum]
MSLSPVETPAGTAVPADQDNHPRSPLVRSLLTIGALVVFLCLCALGSWQVYRLQWKLDLIARVEQRIHAQPEAAPARTDWSQVSVARDEYRHVKVSGVFLHAQSSMVQAVTELGSGYWLLTPLRQTDGSLVFINRGFLPSAERIKQELARASSSETLTLTGLLRITEPGGGFLRHNDAAAGRWFSRDVAAMAAAHQLTDVAPYFVDADAASQTDAAAPVAGLTVVRFQNNHAVYALTWYALALMVGLAYWYVRRTDRRR